MIGHGGQRDQIVDHGRLAEQAFERRQRRLRTDLAAPALQALEHRGFFAADVGAGAQSDFEIESLAAARDVRTQVAVLARNGDGALHGAEGVRIFGAAVDVALGGAHREAAMVMPSMRTNGSPSMIMRSA